MSYVGFPSPHTIAIPDLVWLPHPRLLYADPTLGALEVFVQDKGQVVQVVPDVMPQETVVDGVWIKADPIPGCIVCNIGESEYSSAGSLGISH